MQKADKRINIEVGPFNEVHPSLSQVMEEAREKREERKIERAALMGAALPMGALLAPASSPPPSDNSPYWVQERHLAASRIRVIRSASLWTIPGARIVRAADMPPGQPFHMPDGNEWFEYSGDWITSIQSNAIPTRGLTLDVIRARRFTNNTTNINLNLNATNVMMWYEVEWQGRTGWIHSRHYNGSVIAEPITAGNDDRIIMVQTPPDNPNNATILNNIAQVWGNGRPSEPLNSNRRGAILRNTSQNPDNRGSFAGVRSVHNPEGGTAQFGSINQRGLVDGSVVTIARHSSNRMQLLDTEGFHMPDDIIRSTETGNGRVWVQVNNWRAGRWVAGGSMPSVEESIDAMRAFVEGDNNSNSDLEQAVNNVAAHAISVHGYVITPFNAPSHPNNDFDKFDNMMVAWSFFWNNDPAVDMRGGRIRPDVVKAIAAKESGLGYGSPNLHGSTDIMQVFHPSDPAFNTLSRVGANFQWPGDGAIRRDGYGAVQNMMVGERGDRSQVTPMLSVAFGTRWLGHHISRAGGDETRGIRFYNSGDDRWGFQPSVNTHTQRHGLGTITYAYPRVVLWATGNASNGRELAIRGWAATINSWRNFVIGGN